MQHRVTPRVGMQNALVTLPLARAELPEEIAEVGGVDLDAPDNAQCVPYEGRQGNGALFPRATVYPNAHLHRPTLEEALDAQHRRHEMFALAHHLHQPVVRADVVPCDEPVPWVEIKEAPGKKTKKHEDICVRDATTIIQGI